MVYPSKFSRILILSINNAEISMAFCRYQHI
jgi:hypothetical protein